MPVTLTKADRSNSGKPAVLGGDAAFEHDVFVTRPLVPDPETYSAAVAGVLGSGWLTNDGVNARELERRVAEHLGVAYCASFCNGTTALLIALRALDLEGEVITTPFTFPATPHCIEWNGLTPVFCDIDPTSYNLNPAAVEAAITPKTSAIVPVHVFGNPCDVEAFDDISKRHGIPVVYDAAHAFGVKVGERPIGTFGELSALSFHATKVFHCAEGGAVVSADPARHEKLRLLRNFGIVNENEVSGIGLNGKLAEMHAALGLLVLDEIDDEIARRASLASSYYERLGALPGLRFQQIDSRVTRNHFNFTIEIDEDEFGLSRDELHSALKRERIISRKYFYPVCSKNVCYQELPSSAASNLPVATKLSERILSLPLYGALRSEDVDRIADAITLLSECAAAVKAELTRGLQAREES